MTSIIFPMIIASILGIIGMQQFSSPISNSVQTSLASGGIERSVGLFNQIVRYHAVTGNWPVNVPELITNGYLSSSDNDSGFGSPFSFSINNTKGIITISTDIAEVTARDRYIHNFKHKFKPTVSGITVSTTYTLPKEGAHSNLLESISSGVPRQNTSPSASMYKYWWDTSNAEASLMVSDNGAWKLATVKSAEPVVTSSTTFASKSLLPTTSVDGTVSYVFNAATNSLDSYVWYNGGWQIKSVGLFSLSDALLNTRAGDNILSFNTTGYNNTGSGVNALQVNTTGYYNTATGVNAIQNNTTGYYNTGTGVNALLKNTTGTFNTGIGVSALQENTTGYYNTGTGVNALLSNTTGFYNTSIGTDSLKFNTTGYYNTGTGVNALLNNTTGNYNTAAGVDSLLTNTIGYYNTGTGSSSLLKNTTGYYNTGTGTDSLKANTTGYYNTGTGVNALLSNTTGFYNTGTGVSALQSNTTGVNNTGTGVNALQSNTTGFDNTSAGFYSLQSNTTGYYNTGIGVYSLQNNTTGYGNTGIGNRSLRFNTRGFWNTSIGKQALQGNTSGSQNTALGTVSMQFNTTGLYNTSLGNRSMRYNRHGNNNIASGARSLESNVNGSNNTALGFKALFSSTASNNTAIGYQSGTLNSPLNVVLQSNQVVVGNNLVTNAFIKVPWTVTSDRRDKADIETMTHGLDYINQLRPVTFVWDNRSDYKDGIRDGSMKSSDIQMGFIAQEVLQSEENIGIHNHAVVNHKDAEHLAITETRLIPVLVNAVNELTKKLNKVIKELDDANSKIDMLELESDAS